MATDAGWTGYDRQIGTTGVAVNPELYIAFGVSGAAQHTGGLGAPRHIVSVNTDPSCPMMAMADLGLVTDARACASCRRRAGRADSAVGRSSDRGAPARSPEERRRRTERPPVAESFDAVVVGAGPAGSAAALALARAGRSVVLLERGPFPGSKNIYGGVVYGRVLDAVVPGWWERGAGPALDRPPVDHGDDRRPSR